MKLKLWNLVKRSQKQDSHLGMLRDELANVIYVFIVSRSLDTVKVETTISTSSCPCIQHILYYSTMRNEKRNRGYVEWRMNELKWLFSVSISMGEGKTTTDEREKVTELKENSIKFTPIPYQMTNECCLHFLSFSCFSMAAMDLDLRSWRQ